ncbi:PQQ-dependent catabolism-associated CXXCW motif protein [Rhodovulum steppense]|uniref:PQQ-dependent catabolism-associated CXXCW motif protein n=1 Tax=Rhodovulum steppense TaxID=540251 RepID=A0A4R1YTB8_9RHOB|nr:PQQ-dependent catabolism-associated CXXCW motif protein [Rhodovulum steppense]TCM83520.1 PQQ-dependent catabolism-associated CXXCW motif protein [Rhodovulum steppense]
MIRAAALALVLGLGAGQGLAEVPEPPGYRMDEYRGPVPETLAGATVIDPEQAHALWQAGGAVFVDVMPRAPKPPNLPDGTIWRDPPRLSIPGAIWLPNVGYGEIAEVTHGYFRDGLDRATGGDLARPLVFFCLDECWMSWNAAKRALEYGHARVYWFPEGTDGWTFLALPLERAAPEPGEPGAQ